MSYSYTGIQGYFERGVSGTTGIYTEELRLGVGITGPDASVHVKGEPSKNAFQSESGGIRINTPRDFNTVYNKTEGNNWNYFQFRKLDVPQWAIGTDNNSNFFIGNYSDGFNNAAVFRLDRSSIDLNYSLKVRGNIEADAFIGASLGEQGFTGLQGIQGFTGLKGETGIGSQGPTGMQGPMGPQGQIGIQGNTGIKGSTGVTGIQGIQGSTGVLGNTGIQGIQGITGIQGIQGIQGEIGIQGLQGIQGETGLLGPIGETGAGIQGTTGLQGIKGETGAGIQGTTGLLGPLGETGIQGIQGTTGLSGIKGETGAGIQGTTGLQGIKGETGIQGIQGTTGSGIQGTTGVGIQGATGLLGPAGATGAGIQGTTGLQGIKGETGIQGIPGQTGIQGSTGIGAIYSRSSHTNSTSVILNGSTENINIDGAKGYVLYKIQTSHASWVRIYSSDSARTSDSSRLEGNDPLAGTGVITEVITTSGTTVLITPSTLGFTEDGSNSIPLAVTNKSGSDNAITVTLTLVRIEQ